MMEMDYNQLNKARIHEYWLLIRDVRDPDHVAMADAVVAVILGTMI